MDLLRSKAADTYPSPVMNWRLFVLGLALPSILAGLGEAGGATAADEATLSDAVRFLAREKSAAEQYALILSTIEKTDTARYLRGIKLYSDAKAEFDGLIAELKFDLITGQDPALSTKFTDSLKGAAEKRVAFTTFISNEVVDGFNGERGGMPDVLNVVSELVKAITNAGLSIWKAYQNAGKVRRDAMLNELSHLEWRSFSELVKA